ncbi:hypothetical protein CROQUDRAFT_57659 [Cronartium quercuum f. sp. fusiforme G11]|uniref:Phospho-2-dehydro-3-deoxyheptonate aldolase n=1 Tax=Cronartium quercuum f. sp. fusiforme G11 TaxID=708437 RepID=A0A9P6NSU4_9BASI|nr:hypothetical protein CROQUDRAFT_57659 [Cronartium quercuum f. sp. fusiforme G11]
MDHNSNSGWSPSSWRTKSINQEVIYPNQNQNKLINVKKKLQKLPGLVTPQEIARLKKQLIAVARGEAFLLQGGDCAELFEYCQHEHITSRVKLLLMMSLIIIWEARMPVVRIGRIAGQFAKPRSQPTEIINGKEHLSFRGDIVNGHSLDERTPDPDRLLMAYFHSSATINHIRALLSSGYADLHRPSAWSFNYVRSPDLQAKYEDIVQRLEDSLGFMKTIGASQTTEAGSLQGALNTVDIWTSHEALMLEYEEALTRSEAPEKAPRARGFQSTVAKDTTAPASQSPIHDYLPDSPPLPSYDLSAHFLWVGDRTRQLDHAHLEFLRGVSNPIGIKLGPNMKIDELKEILDLINPGYEQGKVVLICRFGVDNVERCLPDCIKAVLYSAHRHTIFICDPMHGNTKTAEGLPGVKTRYTDDIFREIRMSIQIHNDHGSRLGGVHLEMTGELDEDGYSVTECLGGSMGLKTEHLSLNYQSYCDPRLNYEQSLDVAFLIANEFKRLRQDDWRSSRAVYDLLISPTV